MAQASGFNEGEHPRDQEGQFTDKVHGLPTSKLSSNRIENTPLSSIDSHPDDDVVSYHGRGVEAVGMDEYLVDSMGVYRDGEGNHRAWATSSVSLLDVYDDETPERAIERLDEHQEQITQWVSNQYGADFGDNGRAWDEPQDFTFNVNVSPDTTPNGASTKLYEDTKLVDFDNDLNGGGGLYGFHTNLRDHLDEYDEENQAHANDQVTTSAIGITHEGA